MLLSLLMTPSVISTSFAADLSDFAVTTDSSVQAVDSLSASDEDELDEGEDEDPRGGTRGRSSMASGTVREIQRGFFGKANVGGLGYLPAPGVGLGGATGSGMMVNIGLGQDFVDQEKMSMSWELALSQGLNGGTEYYIQADAGCGVGAPCTEGDLRSYSVEATYELSFYPIRRVGIGFRAGGGVLYSPLLMFATTYQEEILPEYGLAADPGYHNAIHPMGMGGLTFEYYTKLAHFSIGADADIIYGVGWGLGWDASGYLKYTFGKGKNKK